MKGPATIDVVEMEMSLPVSFTPSGKTVTLRQFLDNHEERLSLSSLDLQQMATITAERLRRKPDFKLGFIGVEGVVDKQRAIEEVEALSNLGKIIIELEQNEIRLSIDDY